MSDIMKSFHETVLSRRSCRAYLPEALPQPLIEEILAEAGRAPSNCNTQPWNVHIVSGAKKEALAARLLKEWADERAAPDFTFDINGFPLPYGGRKDDQASRYYSALDIGRDDMAARIEAGKGNYRFFDAPHVALLFMPSIGDNVRVAGDIGMYAQTFLLALAARGLGGIPQTSVSFFASAIREELGVSDDLKLLFAISFGKPNREAVGADVEMPRATLAETVTFHG